MTAEVINDGYEVIKEFTVIFEFTTLCKCFRCFCRTYVHNGSLQSHFKIKRYDFGLYYLLQLTISNNNLAGCASGMGKKMGKG